VPDAGIVRLASASPAPRARRPPGSPPGARELGGDGAEQDPPQRAGVARTALAAADAGTILAAVDGRVIGIAVEPAE
jgi:hypothetical protein